MMTPQRRKKWLQRAAIAGTIVLAGIIIWIDIATPFWQEVVILAGFAGATLSFLFTVLVVKGAVARQNARRWAPLIRLALTEFLHVLADAERSEISRGVIVPRSIEAVGPQPAPTALHALQELVVDERQALAQALSSWAEILSSSGDNETLLLYLADLAVHLDEIRDTSLEVERHPSDEHIHDLNQEIRAYNTKFTAAVNELHTRIAAIPRSVIALEPSPENSEGTISQRPRRGPATPN